MPREEVRLCERRARRANPQVGGEMYTPVPSPVHSPLLAAMSVEVSGLPEHPTQGCLYYTPDAVRVTPARVRPGRELLVIGL